MLQVQRVIRFRGQNYILSLLKTDSEINYFWSLGKKIRSEVVFILFFRRSCTQQRKVLFASTSFATIG